MVVGDILQKIGLTEKEAKVYLACLELGETTASEIATHTGVNRATTYAILEALKNNGLISSFEKGKKTYFVAESPEQLKSRLKIEEESLKGRLANLQKVFPLLQRLYEAKGERPHVRFFEGEEGVAAIRRDILRSRPKRIDFIVPLDESYRFFPPRPEDHRAMMKKRLQAIEWRVIYTSEQGPILPDREKAFQRKFVEPKQLSIATEIVLYGNKAALVAYKQKLIGVILEDEVIVSSLRAIFEFMWHRIK